MDESDIELRNRIYRHFVETGQPPAADEPGLRRLHDAHALVLNPARPRSACSTRSRSCRPRTASTPAAAGGTRTARGTPSASAPPLHVDGRVEASCPDCGEPIALESQPSGPTTPSLLFHCLVPAARWWDDIVFT